MDRSYPYSRRLASRARQRIRLAALVASVLAGAAALSMFYWEPDVISAAVGPAVPARPAFADFQQDFQQVGEAARGMRRIYRYSVVPGGVSSGADLARVMRTDRVVAAHYATFDVRQARPVAVEKPRAVHVSYRKGGQVYWTARKMMLTKGETLLSDGRNEMRARCANRISDVPQYPVEAHQPAMDELDDAVEVDAEYAPGADGMPVSDAGGIPRHTGQTATSHPTLAAAVGAAPATIVMVDGLRRSGISDDDPIGNMGLSGSSSSIGSRPRPTGTGDGAAPSGLPAPSGDTTVPAALPGAPTVPVSSPPGPETSLPPMGLGIEPQPGAPLSPTSPTPERMPNRKPPGGGSTEEPPPVVPPPPAPPQPAPPVETDPFIPEPKQVPPPLRMSTEDPPPPSKVPEPASIWLFGLALTGMLALRKRRRP